MERKEKIIEIAQQIFQERSVIVTAQISKDYAAAEQEIRSELQKAAVKLIQIGKTKQASGQKGAIQIVLISFLYSSAITRSNLFRLSLMDEHNYLNPVDASIYWSPQFIFRYLDEDMACLQKEVSRQLIRVKPYEIDTARRGYICEFYNALAGLFFAQVAKDVFVAADICDLELQEEVKFLFGGLMDRVVNIDTLRKEVSK